MFFYQEKYKKQLPTCTYTHINSFGRKVILVLTISIDYKCVQYVLF